MDEISSENLICSLCENEIQKDDDFCPNCGMLFTEFVKCDKHDRKEAVGVCVICSRPYCEECGLFVEEEVFLCKVHSGYETVEGLACVFFADDYMQLDLIKVNLEEEGLHPFSFPEKISSIHSAIAYTGNTSNNFPLMVPFQEVMRAEEILRDMELLE